MSENRNKRKIIEFSLPEETYKILTEKVRKMNYVNLKEYVVKSLLIDLLNEEEINKFDELISENGELIDLNKVNRDKRIYVRVDDKTFNLLKKISEERHISVSTFVRNIIKDYLEKKNYE